MERQEIKHFRMTMGTDAGLGCDTPCSKYSVLTEHGIIDDLFYGTNIKNINAPQFDNSTFISDFTVDSLILGMNKIYLRLHGIVSSCRVELNGNTLGKTRSHELDYNFDIKNIIHEGVNTLKLHFEEEPHTRVENLSQSDNYFDSLSDFGIFGKIELVGFNNRVIDKVVVSQFEEDGEVKIHLHLETFGEGENDSAVATLISPANSVYYCGFIKGEGDITVSEPNLWWTCGRGFQNLYRLTVNLYCNNEISDSKEMMIGLRKFSLEENREELSLTLNNEKFFAKGGVWVPRCNIINGYRQDLADDILSALKDAKFNTVRVLNGKYLENENFYTKCSKYGIAVIEDINLTKLEEDKTDRLNIVTNHLAMLSTQPCVCMLYIHGDTEEDRQAAENNYAIIAKNILPDTFYVTDEDSLPTFQIKLESDKEIMKESENLHGISTVEGLPSLPNIKTVKTYENIEQSNIFSPTQDCHATNKNDVIRIISGLRENYFMPKDIHEFSYISQLSAAEKLKLSLEQCRYAPEKEGFIFGRINDTYPTLSTSAIDFYGRPKAGYYFAKRCFAPLLLTAKQIENKVEFVLSNHENTSFSGTLTVKVIDSKNNVITSEEQVVSVGALCCEKVMEKDFTEVILNHNKDCYIYYEISNSLTILSSDTMLFTEKKNFKFELPNINAKVSGRGTDYVLTFKANAFVKNLQIDFEETDALFEDNFIDLTDNKPYQISFKTNTVTSQEKLQKELILRSVCDIGRD